MSLAADGEHALAVIELSEALAVAGGADHEPRLLLHRSICRAGCGEYRLALRDADASIALAEDAEAHFLRAKLLLLDQELAEARAAVDAALVVDPRHEPAAQLLKAMEAVSYTHLTLPTILLV